MFEVIAEKTFVSTPAQWVRPGDVNVDGAKCISNRPHPTPSFTGREYVDIVWDDAPLVTHIYRVSFIILIEGQD